MSTFFPYRFERKYLALWGALQASPRVDGVTLTDDERFVATYGRWRVDTALANVTGAHVTGPYKWWKAIGLRLSFADDGLTMGTTTDGGTCVEFAEPVPKVIGRKDHSAVTVTVDDPAGLVLALGFA